MMSSALNLMNSTMAEWILCPVCKNKTRVKIREDTEPKNFPLYYLKRKQETFIELKNLQITVIQKQER